MSAFDEVAVAELQLPDGPSSPLRRNLAVEAPVAFEYDGVAYAVMMATPADLEDFALGFSLSEGMIRNPQEMLAAAAAEASDGWVIRISLAPNRARPWLDRVRLRVVEGSCGLCGVESIEQALQPLPRIEQPVKADPRAIAAALEALPAHQPLGRLTGAMHAAAFCTWDGAIRVVREDVGRHNALDKLIGALARERIDMANGFILVSARCSYELVEKAVRAGCPMLVAISAPTSLAAERAKAAGLTLVALARPDSALLVHQPAVEIMHEI